MMSDKRDKFDKHRSFMKFKVENINDSFYSDTLNYITELELENSELKDDIAYISEQCDDQFIKDIIEKHRANE